jgi:chemotaxis response regulator CheB
MAEAVEVCARVQPDVVLIGLVMPVNGRGGAATQVNPQPVAAHPGDRLTSFQ